MTTTTKLFLCLTLIMTTTIVCQGISPQSLKKIDELCGRLFPENEPGAAVLIMQKNRIVFDKGYGIADINSRKPIDGDTFFNIASVSKQFTAVAILQLAEQGKLSLDDPVIKYYPEFKASFWKDIRIKHLLSHSSGIPDARKGLTRQQRIYGDEQLATAYMKDLDYTHFVPGTNYEYINPTYVLLGDIVSKVSGMPFTQYMEQYVFRPAKMKSTLYFDRNHQDRIPNIAHAYEYGDLSKMGEEHDASAASRGCKKDWYEYDFGEETFFATRPDGGIYTSTHQFVKWENALRNNKVIGEASLRLAHTPQTNISESTFSEYQRRPNTWYGYGWFIEPQTEKSPLKIYHTGDNGGFKILAARYPQTGTLVLIFANRTDWDRYAVMGEIEKHLQL